MHNNHRSQLVKHRIPRFQSVSPSLIRYRLHHRVPTGGSAYCGNGFFVTSLVMFSFGVAIMVFHLRFDDRWLDGFCLWECLWCPGTPGFLVVGKVFIAIVVPRERIEDVDIALVIE